ncbi:M1 family metallopeptidase [Bradyrhizobium sp. HKCCYLS1011]|uniref:M1 family metallopeptidase n=1 Tax=Bradyrhizobium sp. HKCCYLS1011 TaxID=3420733 RepID=UPI003EB7BFB4
MKRYSLKMITASADDHHPPSVCSRRPRSASVAVLHVATLILTTLLPLRLAAEPLFAFDAMPGKLPKTVVPISYQIELTPDLARLTTAGQETVELELREPTARIVLNAVNIVIAEVTLDDGPERAVVTPDTAAETVALEFAQVLPAGRHRLHLRFQSQINSFDRGLFFVDYPSGQGTRRMISSQLEPADARRIFPCWDEPAFKASFALTVTVPNSFLAVSNMPVASEEPVAPDLKRVSFAPTPKMSTYLFVLSAGELERLTADANGVTVDVVTTAGKSAKGRFALDEAVRLLGYYNDYFGTAYPLPKLDLIAIPGGYGGAMENWGGITFFESRLLFDPAIDSDVMRRDIFSIVAHEMAHQWFGDLVTMGWWDNLWLNEGFASWMQEKAAVQLHPQWNTWLNGYGQKQFAMGLDARRTSHPIQQQVGDESEAMVAFDGITYSKGQALIRMIEAYLGEEPFRAGIRAYMAAHASSNTTTADLWQALEQATGKPVAAVAAPFTEQAGVPLVRAETDCHDGVQQLSLRLDRFAIIPARGFAGLSDAKSLPPVAWKLPVMFGPAAASAAPSEWLLDGVASIAAGSCATPVKVNRGDIGYYRVDYGPHAGAALTSALNQMTPEDRLNMLNDAWAMVAAGRADAAAYLGLVERLAPDDRRAIWDQVISSFATLDHLARGEPAREALRSYARTRLRPVFDRLGWDGTGHGDDDETPLRARLIRVLGDLGDADILTEARARFARFAGDPQSLVPALRDPVVHLVGLTADQDSYETLLRLARASTVTSERVRYYLAAANARDPALAARTLALTLTDEMPVTVVGPVFSTVASSAEQPGLVWRFVQDKFDALSARLGPGFRDQMVPNLMTNFTDEEHALQLAHFKPSQATAGGRISTSRALETIAISADFKARALPTCVAWISEHGVR